MGMTTAGHPAAKFIFCDRRLPKVSQRSKIAGTSAVTRMTARMIVVIGLMMTSGCAGPHAVLNFTAPANVTAGTAFTVTVTATVDGQRDTVINSPIIFTSSDPAAVLPAQYLFTSADAGSHTWTDVFILNTPGSQTISATIYDAPGINGSATISVSQ